jgi:hypothetical protein
MAGETNPYFLQLAFSLNAACMNQLGKTANPLTGKVERDLIQAQVTIELLRMLQEKTEGNLSDEEKQALEGIIYGAQMNYLEEVKKDEKSGAGKGAGGDSGTEDKKEETGNSEGENKQ